MLGFGGGGGAYPQYPAQPGHKKILPTLGVSFGLPFPTHTGYPLSPYAPHVPNAHFGAISPNGLNLGLVNVNPLFSLQVTKNEIGEKLVKPFVNLHVTPNEGIVGKIGSLFLAKKGALHKHYHHHLHRYPPTGPHFYGGEHEHLPFNPHHGPPHIEGPPFSPHHPIEGPPFPNHHHHHIEGPPFHGPPHGFEHGPPPHSFEHGPPHFISQPPPYFKDSGFSKGIISDDITSNPFTLGFRSSNVSFDDFNYQSLYQDKEFKAPNSYKDDFRYARQYSNSNFNSLPTQAPGTAEGSEKVSFPTSRRRRDTDQEVPASIEKKQGEETIDELDTEGRAINPNKRQAFYQQQKQCGPRAVCCRKPFNKPPPTQYNRCGVRSQQGINGRIKNPTYVDGNSEFGEWPW